MAELSLSRETYVDLQGNLTFQAYQSFQVETAILFGADKDRAVEEMAEVLKFEIALSNVR